MFARKRKHFTCGFDEQIVLTNDFNITKLSFILF